MLKLSYFQKTIIFLLVIFVYRVYILYTLPYDFYFDEAYYWIWSQNFSFGYYSKPPMIAWIIKLFTSLCGESEFCIKLPSSILYFFSSIFIYLSAKELYNEKTAFYASILFFTLPSVFLSSLIISTDSVFLFFWALSLYLFIKVLKSNALFLWILLGVSLGFGLLSKYTMILFAVGALFYIYLYKRELFKKSGVYLTAIVSFLIFLPNLIWNFQNGFVTFLHTKDNADIRGFALHFDKMFEFLASQLGVFGIIFFPILLYLLFRFKRFKKDERFALLWFFITPLFLVITLVSILSRAHANWSAPIYIASSILVAWYLLDRAKLSLLKLGIIINILLGMLIYHFDGVISLFGIELNSKNDPYKKTRDWAKSAKEIEKIMKTKKAKLIFDDRMNMSEFIYYLKPHPFDALFWNPSKRIDNYFALVGDLNKHKGESFWFISSRKRDDLERYFKRVTFVKRVDIKIHNDYHRVYFIYFVEGFKGY